MRLREYGINDPIKDMINKNNVYTLYDPVWLNYLKAHYNKCITASVISQYEDYEFIRYMAPKENYSTNIIEKLSNDSCISEKFDDIYNVPCTDISVMVNNDITANDYQSYYLAVVNEDGIIYSYALNKDGNKIYGSLLNEANILKSDIYLCGEM